MLPWFTKYPNQNDEILNLDFVIKQVENLKAAYEAFLAANSLTFADPIVWDITKQYSKNTIVLSSEGDAYLSKKVVGAGVQLNNTDYWLEIFNFAEYVRTANSNLTLHIEQNTTRATAAYAVDDWLLWEDVLYKVTAAIAVDDLLTVGTNIVHFTVEDFCRAWATYMVNTIAQYKRDIDASELAYKNELSGIVTRYKNDIDASESAYRAQLAGDITSTTASLQAQLNLAISGATVDSEVINARLGADGVTYSTLGEAIRTQIERLNLAAQTIPSVTKSCYQNNLHLPDAVSSDNIDIADEDSNVIAAIDYFGNFKCKNFNTRDTSKQTQAYSSSIDFAIMDEDGNIALEIYEGILVGNQTLRAKKVSILGDSISTYSGYLPSGYASYYPYGNVNAVDKTWWYKLINELSMSLLMNASYSGATVAGDSQGSAIVCCSDARIADLKDSNNVTPDIVFVYVGTNDWGNNVPLGSFTSTDEIPDEGVINNFSEAYALMLYKIRTTYPNAEIVCFTLLEGRLHSDDYTFPVLNANGNSIHEFNHAITEISHIFGASIVDLTTCGLHYWNVNSYTVDTMTHPNESGQRIIKTTVKQDLLNKHHKI